MTLGAPIGFVGVSDLAAAKGFYGGVLGLTFTDENPYALTVSSGAARVLITEVPAVAVAGYTVLGWTVDDIAAEVSRLTAAGVAFQFYDGMEQAPNGVWTEPGGDQIAWFHDPDGNVLSLTQWR